jgi:DNA-directed RNA polymerase beta' subunit
MSLHHQCDLQAQRNETANLKEQLVQAGLQHAGALKEAIAAGEAKVEEAKKQLAEAHEQLRQELEVERKLLKLEQERNIELSAIQASIGQMVKDTDDKALSRCSCPLLTRFRFLPVYSHTSFF